MNAPRTIHIGADHAGFHMKQALVAHLKDLHYEVVDHGTYSEESTDYPDYAHAVASAVEAESGTGILLCGSANGVCMTANKHQGVRAALCWNPEVTRLAREHNNANVLCLPARYLDTAIASEMVQLFLETPFEGGRHERRVSKIACS